MQKSDHIRKDSAGLLSAHDATTDDSSRSSMRDFQIDVDQSVLDDLNVRLDNTRWRTIIFSQFAIN